MAHCSFIFLAALAVSIALGFEQTNNNGLRGGRHLQGFVVDSMELIQVGSNTVVATLSNNAVVTIDPNESYNIKAVVSGSGIGSVQFTHDGDFARTENVAPYAFCGDSGGNYFDCGDLVEGLHTVTATPYSNGGGNGSAGGSHTITFTLSTTPPGPPPTLEPTLQPTSGPTQQPTLGPTQQPVKQPTPEPSQQPVKQPTATPSQQQLTLEPTTSTQQPVNPLTPEPTTQQPVQQATPEPTTQQPTPPPTQQPVAQPTPQPFSFNVDSMELIEVGSNQVVAVLSNNDVVAVDPTQSYNIHAVTSGTTVQSVQFQYNGNVVRTEGIAPYAFCGDAGGNFFACQDLVVDVVHTVTATPYSGGGASGEAGGAQTVTFTLTVAGSEPGTPAPSSTPPVTPASPTTTPEALPATAGPQPTPQPVAPSTGACKIPKFVGNWQDPEQYPIPAAEAQGAVIGNDLIVVSGFSEGYGQATKKNFALDLTNPDAGWRPIADLPVSDGITHGAFTVVGSKFYMYVGEDLHACHSALLSRCFFCLSPGAEVTKADTLAPTSQRVLSTITPLMFL